MQPFCSSCIVMKFSSLICLRRFILCSLSLFLAASVLRDRVRDLIRAASAASDSCAASALELGDLLRLLRERLLVPLAALFSLPASLSLPALLSLAYLGFPGVRPGWPSYSRPAPGWPRVGLVVPPLTPGAHVWWPPSLSSCAFISRIELLHFYRAVIAPPPPPSPPPHRHLASACDDVV